MYIVDAEFNLRNDLAKAVKIRDDFLEKTMGYIYIYIYSP